MAGDFDVGLTKKSKYAARTIVEILDGEVRPDRCSERGDHHTDDAPCSTREVWDEARVALEGVFNHYSIAQLAEAARESPGRRVARALPLLHAPWEARRVAHTEPKFQEKGEQDAGD